MENSSLRTFWAYSNCRTGHRLRSSNQNTWQDIPASLKLVTWVVSIVALESGLQIYVCLLRCFCWLFQLLLYPLYRLHNWQLQDRGWLKIPFLTYFPSHRENTPRNWVIPDKKISETHPPFLWMMKVNFPFFCALYSHKAHCLNQWEPSYTETSL